MTMNGNGMAINGHAHKPLPNAPVSTFNNIGQEDTTMYPAPPTTAPSAAPPAPQQMTAENLMFGEGGGKGGKKKSSKQKFEERQVS